jgi:hypothetical protein
MPKKLAPEPSSQPNRSRGSWRRCHRRRFDRRAEAMAAGRAPPISSAARPRLPAGAEPDHNNSYGASDSRSGGCPQGCWLGLDGSGAELPQPPGTARGAGPGARRSRALTRSWRPARPIARATTTLPGRMSRRRRATLRLSSSTRSRLPAPSIVARAPRELIEAPNMKAVPQTSGSATIASVKKTAWRHEGTASVQRVSI